MSDAIRIAFEDIDPTEAYRLGFEAARDAAAREIEESGAKWGTRILAERIRALVPGDTHGR